MSLEIRPARASDLDALVAIEQAVFDADRISRRAFRALIIGDHPIVLVAEAGGMIAGCCVILTRADSHKARLYSLAAAPGRTGVGRALLQGAEAAARARGSTGMRLEVRADNARAIALYEKAGYRVFGQKPDYYADGATALRFEKLFADQARASSDMATMHGTPPP